MARLADRVKETTTTTGTGTVNLAGTSSGYRTFVAGIGDGKTCCYCIQHQSADEWEVGVGTVTDASPDTLSRTTVLASSNSGALVSFSSGTKDVFVPNPAANRLPRGHIDGLTLSNNGSDANNDIDVAAGEARDGTDTTDLVLEASITKRLDASWAVGTNQGGLDTGSEANSTWYHVWLIKRPDTGVVDVLFSTSATSPTMPTNYTLKRRIGSVRNDGSGNLLAFLQAGDWFFWKTSPALDVNATNSASRQTATILVPSGVRVLAMGNVLTTVGSQTVFIACPDINDQAPSVTATPLFHVGSNASIAGALAGSVQVMTNTSAQITWRGESTNGTFRWATLGWRDFRGKDGL